jgi:hypothetical protein
MAMAISLRCEGTACGGSIVRPPTVFLRQFPAVPRRAPRAALVGRENVVASADCGFSSQATYTPEIHPRIVWAKFEALAEGARRATARPW